MERKDISINEREKKGERASLVGIILNILLSISKCIVGIFAASMAIVADGLNNLSDVFSSAISLIGFKLSNKPSDKEHPYGHGRYEYVAGVIVATLIIVVGVELIINGIGKILEPTISKLNIFVIIVLSLSILVKLVLMIYYYIEGKKINSKLLLAVGNDSRNDMIITFVILVSSIISHFTSIVLDGYMTVLVAIFIIINGIQLIKDTISPLLGMPPTKDFCDEIRKKVLSYEYIEGCHDLIIHDYGPGRKFATIHVEINDSLDISFVHDIIDKIERDIQEEYNMQMTIHCDPVVINNQKIDEIKKEILERVREIDDRITIHDVRVIFGSKYNTFIFDCVIPRDLKIEKKEIEEKITELINLDYNNTNCVITIDYPYELEGKWV